MIAETSLYIPGFDEQPVSVDVLGVGPDGRTTWQIVPSKPTGTVSSAPLPLTGKFAISRSVVHSRHGVGVFVVCGKKSPNKRWLTFRLRFLFCTATMVQGPSDAVVHASFPQIDVSLSCALKSGQADCVGQIQQPGMTMTTSLRESVKPYLVQGGGSGGGPSSPGPTPVPLPSQSGSLSSTGTDNGSGVMSGAAGGKMLVGGVVTGIVATLFLV